MAVKVFVDANLLFYKLISDLLFDASNLGLIEAHWSEAVIAEYLEHGPRVLNEIRTSKGLPTDLEKAQNIILKKIELFKKYSGFILVGDYEAEEIPDDSLDDKNNVHVLKAALRSNCSVLLTLDKGFKGIESLDNLRIVAKKADEFFCELFDKHEKQMMDVIYETRKGLARQKKQDVDLNELPEMFGNAMLAGLARKLSEHLGDDG